MTNSVRVLVTGSSGQIGSELSIELARKFGTENVITTDIRAPSSQREPNFTQKNFRYLDVTDKESIERLLKEEDIAIIFHLAGILSATGETFPERTWLVNTGGLRNVLEASVKVRTGTAKIFWPSSIAVFGPSAPKRNTPQDSCLEPTTMYGITKVAGELLCNYYHSRYGLDARSIRFPGIISSDTLPGGGTTDYAVEIFHEALRSGKYTCFVRRDTVLPLLYMPDCIRATIDLMDADPSKIKIRTSYNLGGLTFSAGDLANEIDKYVKGFQIEYRPDSRQRIADSWPISIDDSTAQRDWGWKPTYDMSMMTKEMIQKLSGKVVRRA